MRPPKAEASFTLICEDIRSEASGRLSLMGVCGPLMDVPGLPGLLSSLCAVVFVRNPAEPLRTVTISIIDPNGAPLGGPNTQQVVEVHDDEKMYQFQVKAAPFPVSTEGVWTFRFTFNDTDEIGMDATIRVRNKQSGAPQPQRTT